MHSDLKVKTVSNIGYNTFAKVGGLGLSTFARVILARNLTSVDYGIVGFASIFIGFLGRFDDLGISNAVVQKNELDERGIYTGFTIKAILSIAVFAAAFVFSPLTNAFFDNSAIEGVIKILSLNFIIGIFSFLPTCVLTRRLNYKKLFVPQASSVLISSLLSIALALNGFKYWSIVLASVGSTAVYVIILNIIKPVRIRFSLDKNIVSGLIKFGGSLFLSGIVVFVIFNADNFIIGTVNGSKTLGYYALAFNWGSMICGVLYDSIHSVLFPTFSRIQENRETLITSYLRSLQYISFIAIMVNLVLLIGSREFLFLVLGHGSDKWLPALTALRILCIYGMLRALLEPVANVLMAIGKPNVLLKSNILVGIIEIGLLYPTAKYAGIEGVATLVTVCYALQYLIYFPYLKREVNLSICRVLACLKPAIISALFTVGVCSALQLFKFQEISYLTLLLKTSLAAVGYFVSYGVITKWRLVYETKSLVGNMISVKKAI